MGGTTVASAVVGGTDARTSLGGPASGARGTDPITAAAAGIGAAATCLAVAAGYAWLLGTVFLPDAPTAALRFTPHVTTLQSGGSGGVAVVTPSGVVGFGSSFVPAAWVLLTVVVLAGWGSLARASAGGGRAPVGVAPLAFAISFGGASSLLAVASGAASGDRATVIVPHAHLLFASALIAAVVWALLGRRTLRGWALATHRDALARAMTVLRPVGTGARTFALAVIASAPVTIVLAVAAAGSGRELVEVLVAAPLLLGNAAIAVVHLGLGGHVDLGVAAQLGAHAPVTEVGLTEALQALPAGATRGAVGALAVVTPIAVTILGLRASAIGAPTAVSAAARAGAAAVGLLITASLAGALIVPVSLEWFTAPAGAAPRIVRLTVTGTGGALAGLVAVCTVGVVVSVVWARWAGQPWTRPASLPSGPPTGEVTR
jgi:hypothetical protein